MHFRHSCRRPDSAKECCIASWQLLSGDVDSMVWSLLQETHCFLLQCPPQSPIFGACDTVLANKSMTAVIFDHMMLIEERL